MKLERVIINKFWDKYNLDLCLDSDVNILTGNNGSGKTTILDIIASLLANNKDVYCHLCYDTAILYMSEDWEVHSTVEHENERNVVYIHNGVNRTHDDFITTLKAQAVSTFDAPLIPVDMIKKMREENSHLKSDLDITLQQRVNEYNKFRSTILNRMQEMMDGDNPQIEDMRNLTSVLNNFRNTVNDFFYPKKNYNEKDGELYFRLNQEEGKMISFNRLSSGEKQLMILLFSTIIQNGRECIAFWDEPEVSLHIEWQRKLIRVIRALNPNMQLIIATHSPSILFEGWENRVLNIEELLEQ